MNWFKYIKMILNSEISMALKKIKPGFIIIFIGMMVVAHNGKAGPADSMADKQNQLGFKTGLNSGSGIAYTYWPGKLGMEVSLGPNINNVFTEVHLGMAGLYSIHKGSIMTHFATIGNDCFYTKSNEEFLSPYSKSNSGFTWDLKAGLGTRIIIVEHVLLNVVAGVVNERVVRGGPDVAFNGELGLFYSF